MAYLTREEALTELGRGDAVLFGDPNRDVPLAILDQAKQGVGSSPLVPAEIAKNLLEAGLIAAEEGSSSTGKRRLRLSR